VSDNGSPRRETIIRAAGTGLEFRSSSNDDLGPGYLGLLRILFSPVNEWTEIRSAYEGNFMERFAPGSWKKTIAERASQVRSLFQHGMDPQIGDKPLGPIHRLEENENGGYGEVALLDTSYNRDLLPALKDGLYGSSHRFEVMREKRDQPGRSDYNPDGIEERTIIEARLREFGPVTWGAYEGATAGMRSMTDEFLLGCIRSNPAAVRDMLKTAIDLNTEAPEEQEQDTQDQQDNAPSDEHAEPATVHLSDERRETTPSRKGKPIYGMSRKETSKPWLLGPSKSTKRT